MSVIAGRAPPTGNETTIVYDGACPFCSQYVKLLRLRASVGPVTLLDARDGGPLVADIRARGLDLDQGMVLAHEGAYHHGADCLQRLALLTTPSGMFNRVTAAVFRSPGLSRALYPVLRCGRAVALLLLGRSRLGVAPSNTWNRRRQQRLVLAIPALLMIYAAIALSWSSLGPIVAEHASGELFPFFNWSLFSSPQVEGVRYAVRITGVQPPEDYGASLLGRTLDDIDSFGVQANIRFHKTARALAQAQRRGDAAAVEQLRLMLSNFLRPYGITEFELLRYTYDPLDYYDSGETTAEAVVGRYRSDGPP